MLTILIDGYQLPIFVGRVFERRHIGVGMSAQHEVAAFGKTEEPLVGIFGDLPAEVGDADDEVALLLAAQDVDVLLARLCGIEIGDALAVAIEDEPFSGGANAKSPILTPSRTIVI